MTASDLRNLPLDEWFIEVMGREFWTRLDEMVADIEEYGYTVLDANDEYIVVDNDTADDADETILYLGHANTTIWIERVRQC